ncbi:hypothetical protein [Rhodovulum bhavnagarense]|nr:hypothetical protein [Rhodovulum bhavnagarense]
MNLMKTGGCEKVPQKFFGAFWGRREEKNMLASLKAPDDPTAGPNRQH